MKNLKPLRHIVPALLFLVLSTSAAFALTMAAQKCKIKYSGLDKDKNCVITRTEWKGKNQSFQEHDWNHDGILSGEEIQPGAKKPDIGEARIVLFKQLDINNDGIISRTEWRGTTEAFNSLDTQRDGVLTRPEFIYQGYQTEFNNRPTPTNGDPFKDLDRNRDSFISRSEWNGMEVTFNRLDDNGDGQISVQEFHERANADRFTELDHNRDGYITTNEWHASSRSFTSLDKNGDRKISRDEYFHPQRNETLFSELDDNGDGAISLAEWRGNVAEFYRLDSNGNKVLTKTEFYASSDRGVVERVFEEIFR